MCNNPEYITAYEKEMGERSVINSMLSDATNKGIEQVVRQMLKEKMSYEIISKVSGLGIDEIKKLENQE